MATGIADKDIEIDSYRKIRRKKIIEKNHRYIYLIIHISCLFLKCNFTSRK